MCALLNLASTESTRRRLVTHRGLLQTLIRYSKNCQDGNAKENVKNMILTLIPPDMMDIDPTQYIDSSCRALPLESLYIVIIAVYC